MRTGTELEHEQLKIKKELLKLLNWKKKRNIKRLIGTEKRKQKYI